MQNVRLRFTALILIISMAPRTGLEMYTHQLLHQSKISQTSSSDNSSSQQLSISCNCLDDSFMPLSETAPPVITAPEKESIVLFNEEYQRIISISKNFRSLRGPPTA
jgi:hypothetical protein